MVQMNLYDYFGMESDPLYMVLSKVREGENITIDEFEVKRNSHGIYEISTDEIHEAKQSLEACYKFIKENTASIFFS